MSKKHFELLAKYISSMMDTNARLQAAVAVASACKEANQRFDEDQWDGEQQVYRPVGDVKNVDHLVIYNGE